MPLPNLIVIGAMKAGTSSLHYYLSLHPEIGMSAEKELDFFVDHNWGKGVDWYVANFPQAPVRGESSPNYTAYPVFGGVPERMHALIPDARLIYVVRDPIERMVSHYIHSVHRRRETRPPEEALADFSSLYMARSLYFMQLERYLAQFPPSQIHVVTAEALLHDRLGALQNIFRFLGVAEDFSSTEFDAMMHSSAEKGELIAAGQPLLRLYQTVRAAVPLPAPVVRAAQQARRRFLSRKIERPQISGELRERLAQMLAPDVAQLRSFTGQKFDRWSL